MTKPMNLIELHDAIAKAIADAAGHGMREKCERHADAVLAIVGPQLLATAEHGQRIKSDEPNGSYLAHITANQAQNLLDYFGGESTTYVLIRCKEDEVATDDDGTPMPAGLYVYDANCPEEGVIYLGDEDEDAKPTDLADQPHAVPDGLGAEELAEFAKTIADFNDFEETETPHHTLMRWAEMGLLECERFNITAKGRIALATTQTPGESHG